MNERNEFLESSIEPHHHRGELLRKCDLIIWDEAPMANRAVLACVEECCRKIMDNQIPFGGKVVILLGDFRQTCPVIPRGTKADVLNASIPQCNLWPLFRIARLTTPIRNADDPFFASFVDEIGEGTYPEVALGFLHLLMKLVKVLILRLISVFSPTPLTSRTLSTLSTAQMFSTPPPLAFNAVFWHRPTCKSIYTTIQS